ncbi:fucokinase [Strigomonas culicis]|uniref:Fucokinase n=1 Tax=Strigomonas culicis TaxID=28005 RepID=S9VTN3_9TRYP|nr:fucokinase [Strigomonas culicis]|eukprot:EPY30521.1 fucokinase [Strigomonas culicis]
MFLNEQRQVRTLQEMLVQSQALVEAIAQVDFVRYGKLIGRAWRQNIALDRGATTDTVDAIVALVQDEVWGLKLAGAGGGGYLYMVAKDLNCAQRIRERLERDPPNNRARFVELHLSTVGVDVSTS